MQRTVWLTAALLLGLIGSGAGCKQSSRTDAPAPAKPTVSAPPVAADDPWADPPPVAKDPLKKPLFWAATKDGITTYFLGTMHLGIDAESRLPDVVFAKLDAAKTFAMETDIADPSVANIGKRTTPGTIESDLGPEYWKKLQDLVTPEVANAINAMKPMVAATLVSMRGLKQTAPMDRVLQLRAAGKDKPIVYLEPASLQAEVISKYMGVRELKVMLDNAQSNERRMQQLFEAYVAGDESVFLTLTDEGTKEALDAGFTQAEIDESNEAMIYRRNASWIEPIEKLHAAGGGFVAVGALHLVGPKNVLALLSERGFKIERITP